MNNTSFLSLTNKIRYQDLHRITLLSVMGLFITASSAFISPSYADDPSLAEVWHRIDEAEQNNESLKAQIKELRGRIEELEHRQRFEPPLNTSASLPASPAPSFNVAPQNIDSQDMDPVAIDPSAPMDPMEQSALDDLLTDLGGSPLSPRDQATQDAHLHGPTLSLDMDESSAQYNQAMALFNAREYAQAEEAFRYYVNQFRNGNHAYAAKAKIAQCSLEIAKENNNKEKAREAMKEYANLYKIDPKGTAAPEALLGLAQSMNIAGETKKACPVLAKITSTYSSNKEAVTSANSLKKQYNCSGGGESIKKKASQNGEAEKKSV